MNLTDFILFLKLLLSVVPLTEGTLWIEGIGFKLCGTVWGHCHFTRLFTEPSVQVRNILERFSSYWVCHR